MGKLLFHTDVFNMHACTLTVTFDDLMLLAYFISYITYYGIENLLDIRFRKSSDAVMGDWQKNDSLDELDASGSCRTAAGGGGGGGIAIGGQRSKLVSTSIDKTESGEGAAGGEGGEVAAGVEGGEVAAGGVSGGHGPGAPPKTPAWMGAASPSSSSRRASTAPSGLGLGAAGAAAARRRSSGGGAGGGTGASSSGNGAEAEKTDSAAHVGRSISRWEDFDFSEIPGGKCLELLDPRLRPVWNAHHRGGGTTKHKTPDQQNPDTGE